MNIWDKKHLTKMIKDSSYLSIYNTSNKILYKMFEDYPENRVKEHIVAKALILGRTYAAAIERRKSKDGLSNDDFYIQKVTKCFISTKMGKDIKKIRSASEELQRASMSLSLHGKLQDSFKPDTKLNKRSFCSKYLHFQLPDDFYLYDTRAANALSRFRKHLPQMKQHLSKFPPYQDNWDKTYWSFYRGCYCLSQTIANVLKKNLSKREIDSLLLTVSK